jgi:hypothetical protein
MIPLASSNLAAYDYDPESRVLTIQFTSGRSYRYKDVPADVADGLGSADSPRRYFNASIKGTFAET